ncbi:hypothetical protein [Aestuariivirga litoralis]|nr:hypothetical protein [Aestuariivirga litoralis]
MNNFFNRIADYRLKSMRQQIYASAGPCPELFSSLRSYRLDQETVQAYAGIYSVTLASFTKVSDGDAIFEIDIDGQPTAVIEALLYDDELEQQVADLVAWPLHDPDNFATALGPHAGADVLGVEHMVMRKGRPLRVYRTPLEWLQAGCNGCVPLTEIGGRFWLNRAGGPFLVGCLDEARWLRDYLGVSAVCHCILLPFNGRRAA